MSDYVFLALSLAASVAVIADLLVLKKSINPLRIMAYLFLVIGVATPYLWDGVKGEKGSGVPPALEYGDYKFFEITCLTAVIALLSISIIFELFSKKSISGEAKLSLQNIKILHWRFSLAILVLWLLGQGTSVFEKSVYLSSNGLSFLTKPTALLAPILATAIFCSELLVRRSISRPTQILSIAWIVLLASVGSRLAIFPLIVLALHVYLTFGRRVKEPFFRFCLSLGTLYATVFLILKLFHVSLVSRGQPHGMTNLWRLLNSSDSPQMLIGNEWTSTLKALVVSISSIYPIVNISAYQPMDPNVILQNANPLPADLLTLSDDLSNELILPWLPKAFLGELLGTFGLVGLLAVLAIWAAVTLFTFRKAIREGQNLIAIFVGVAFSLALLSGLQYPSRIAFRFFSTVYLALAILVIIRKRKKRLSQQQS